MSFFILFCSREKLSCFTAAGHARFAGPLYAYIIRKEDYQTSASRQALVRRMREALMKLIVLVGVPKCIDAIFSIGAQEADEDKDYSCSRYNGCLLNLFC